MIEINKFLKDETKWGTNHREWFKTLFCGYEIAETKEFKELIFQYIKKTIEKTTLKFFNGYIENTKDNPVASKNKKEFKEEFLKYNKIILEKESTKEELKEEAKKLIKLFVEKDELIITEKIIVLSNELKLFNMFDKKEVKEIINKNTKDEFEKEKLFKHLISFKIGKKVIF